MLILASPVKAEPKGDALISTLKDPKQISILSQLRSFSDPLSQHVLQWIYLTQYAEHADFEQIRSFVTQNPDWPRQRTLARKAEEKLSTNTRPYTLKQWFDAYAPQTLNGLTLYTYALDKLGYTQNIQKAVKSFWLDGDMDQQDLKRAMSFYNGVLSPQDHINRTDKLIWDGRYSEARMMLPYTPDKYRRIFNARIKLATDANGVDSAISQVYPQDIKDPGLMFERIRWHRRAHNNSKALSYLNDKTVDQSKYASSWWRERHILIRREIEDGNFQNALQIAMHHRQKNGFSFAQAEFLTGWLHLRTGTSPDKALMRFTSLYNGVNSPISLSRGAYWTARAYEAMGQNESAKIWYQKASEHSIYFYGQLANSKLDQPLKVNWIQSAPDISQSPLLNSRWFAIIKILNSWGLSEHTDGFFAKAFKQANTTDDQYALAYLAREIGRYDQVIRATKNIQADTNAIPPESYPSLSYLAPHSAFKPHVLGLIRQESMFYTAAQSHAGAKGLMQLMPATAKETARKAGLSYSKDRLTSDGDYNTQLGISYLELLLEKYDGNLILATAAYNAGPGRVDRWIKTFGDPRNPKIDPIDWIEGLPVYETRNYVQRVLEATKVYTVLLNQERILIAGNNHKL